MKKISLIALSACALSIMSCDDKAGNSKNEVTVTTTVNDSTIVNKTVFAINQKVNGKEVDLKIENGVINSLTIDGKTIEKQDYAKYTDLTDGIVKNLPKSPEPPEPPTGVPSPSSGQADEDDKMSKTIEEQLKKDGVFKGDNVKYEFDLTRDELSINGKVQSKETLNKYLELFKKIDGKELGKKLHIKLREDRVEKH